MLEEHAGCEIPAGCGGVILRWYDPAREIAASVWMVTAPGAEAFLDGRPLANGRPALALGPHAIALRVPRPGPGGFVVGLVVWSGASGVRASAAVDAHLRVVTEPGEGWRWTSVAPDPRAWTDTGFDDRGWSPMIACPGPRDGTGDVPYALRYVHAHRGQEIGVPVDGPVWVRHAFRVSLEPGR